MAHAGGGGAGARESRIRDRDRETGAGQLQGAGRADNARSGDHDIEIGPHNRHRPTAKTP
jgi:hypothetical protein